MSAIKANRMKKFDALKKKSAVMFDVDVDVVEEVDEDAFEERSGEDSVKSRDIEEKLRQDSIIDDFVGELERDDQLI